jgi:hypothetical protein
LQNHLEEQKYNPENEKKDWLRPVSRNAHSG